MSAKQTAVVTALRHLGWKPNPDGYLTATMLHGDQARDYRIKIQDSSILIELKCSIGKPDNPQWIRFGGALYSQIKILENRNVVSGALVFKPLNKEPA